MAINSTLITTAGNDIFTCPTDEEHAVTCMMFCNYSTQPVTLDLWLLGPTPAAISNTSIVIHELDIPAGETFTFDTEKIILSSGERVHAQADVDSRLSVTVSSMRVS